MVTEEPTWLMLFCQEQHTLRRQLPTSTQRAGHSRPGEIQWNLSNTDILRTKIIVLFSEVAFFQRSIISSIRRHGYYIFCCLFLCGATVGAIFPEQGWVVGVIRLWSCFLFL